MSDRNLLRDAIKLGKLRILRMYSINNDLAIVFGNKFKAYEDEYSEFNGKDLCSDIIKCRYSVDFTKDDYAPCSELRNDPNNALCGSAREITSYYMVSLYMCKYLSKIFKWHEILD